MQCPSCGFENMPGRQECAVCSTHLTSCAQRESVIPPRAKDRTLRQRVRWRLENNQPLSVASERARDARRSIADNFNRIRNREYAVARNVRITFSWITLRNLWLLLISIIPGFGYIFGRRDKLTGLMYLYGSLAGLLLALVSYKTYIADIIVWGIAAASIISVSVAADCIIPKSNGAARLLSRLGITLLVISVVCNLYLLITYAPGSPISRATVIAEPLTDIVAMDDRLMLWNGAFNRGDVVVGHMVDGQRGVGVVVGIPGDSVKVSSNGGVYLNGKPLKMPPQDPAYYLAGRRTIQSYGDTIIPSGKLLVTQTIQGGVRGADLHSMSVMDYADIGSVQGRIVAVMWPPAHRKIVRSSQIGELKLYGAD